MSLKLPLRGRKFWAFVAVGVMNTGFGYGLFAALNYLFSGFVHGYLAACCLGNVIAISIAYVNYKSFVFRTKGNYLKEYLRFYLVYGASFLVNIVLLTLLVEHFGLNSYLAGAILIPVVVVVSFVGHNTISFKSAAR